MKRFYSILLVITLSLTISQTFAATKTWIGGTGTGKNWTTAANWSPSGAPASGDDIVFNTAGSITFSTMPGSTAYNSITVSQGTVIIAAGSNMTLTIGGNSGTDLTVASGASLTIGTNVSITLASNATANFSGTFTINSGRTYNTNGTSVVTTVSSTGTIVNSGTLTCTTASKLLMNSGSTYQHSQSAGNVPTATWNSNSTMALLNWANSGNTPTNLSGQTFGHFNLGPFASGGGNTGSLLTSAGTITCAGNFTADCSARPIAIGGGNYNVTLNVGGNFSITSGTFSLVTGNGSSGNAVMNVSGNFSIASGTTLSAAGSGTKDITFNGTAAQSVTQSGTLTDAQIRFTVNNTSATGITLSTPLTLSNSLTFTDGLVNTTATNILTIADNATVSGASSASFVDGPMIKLGNDDFSFPVGDATGGYHPIGLNNTSAGTTTDSYTAEYIRSTARSRGIISSTSGIYAVSGCEHWSLVRNSGTAAADVTIGWTSESPCGGSYVSQLLGLTVAWLNGSTQWDNATGTAATASGNTTTAGTLTRTGVTSFGYFSLATLNIGGAPSPLPVKLGDFTAKVQNGTALLNWNTLTEINSHHFEIERSLDGIRFSAIGSVNAAGNSNDNINYQYTDNVNGLTGLVYYRLKTVDIDTKSEYSKIVAVKMNGASIKEFTVFPNPCVDNMKVSVTAAKETIATVRITNMSGQQVVSKSIHLQQGNNVLVLTNEISNLKPGMHMLELISAEGVQTQKIIKK